MKQFTHAWLALKAMEVLKGYSGHFNEDRNKYVKRLLNFMSRYPTTFLRGAWFPDKPIRDNLQGGHTWKYSLEPVDGRIVIYRPPSHNKCLSSVDSDLGKKVNLDTVRSDLPDRCEALSQTIRDTTIITNKVGGGDVIAFNDSQVAIFYLMLAHYVCDAHVPLHCDKRDLDKPSKVHHDLEYFWEREIKKYYRVSKTTKQFDLDENQHLQLNTKTKGFEKSILGKCDEILEVSAWNNMNQSEKHWRAFLGTTNKNLWDYLVSVCLVSFHMSLKMFPPSPPNGVDYDKVRIMKVQPFKDAVIRYSPFILADAINSVALVWLATWERWELLEKGIR